MASLTKRKEKYQGFNLPFNPKPSTLIHIDLNSCFATIEQQANPLLRGRPIAVAAYTTPSGCILAASIEAKRFGVKTGMRVKDGQRLCPGLVIKDSDPWKYRNVHFKLKRLLSEYTDQLNPKSIDEFILDLEGYPAYRRGMETIAREMKVRIKAEIGDWLTVSIGIGPNRFLAKTAAGLHKPDGLDEINLNNYHKVYENLTLPDLCGIAHRNTARLNGSGIYTVWDMFNAPISTLKSAFESILGYYWYLRLRGWEIDDVEFGRKSYGNSFALPKPLTTVQELSPIISKLVNKMAHRMRRAGYRAQGIHLSLVYRDLSFWHQGMKTKKVIFESREIYRHIFHILHHCPYQKPVREVAVSCFNLVKEDTVQLDLFGEVVKNEKISQAVDDINEKWGNFVITPARMLGTGDVVIDRVAFGGIKELEDFTLNR